MNIILDGMLLIIVALLVLGVFALLFGAVIFKAFRGRLNQPTVHVKTAVNAFQQQQIDLTNIPKSIFGMTAIYLPRISVDFPAFHYREFRQKAENMLCSAFAAMTEQDISWLVSASDELKTQIRLAIEDDKRQGKQRTYQDVTIHRTEITNYQKQSGACVITLQSAVGYLYYAEIAGRLVGGNRTFKTQTRYNTELVYVQDAAKVNTASANRAVGIICPSCGAPVTNLGQKRCEYCGNTAEPVNHYAWAINRIKEV